MTNAMTFLDSILHKASLYNFSSDVSQLWFVCMQTGTVKKVCEVFSTHCIDVTCSILPLLTELLSC